MMLLLKCLPHREAVAVIVARCLLLLNELRVDGRRDADWATWHRRLGSQRRRGEGHARARRQPWHHGSADRTSRPSSCDERRSPISSGILDWASGIGMLGFRTAAQRLSSCEGWSGNEVRMRSGDPGPDRPRGRREGPDLAIFATRTVPARPLFLRFFPSRICGGPLGGLPLPRLLGNMHVFFGLDLPCRKVPMLLMPAVRLPLGFPKQIGALLNTLLLL